MDVVARARARPEPGGPEAAVRAELSALLPPQAQAPVITVQIGQTTDAMYMGFYSDVLPTNNITDFLVRVVKPKLDSLEGV